MVQFAALRRQQTRHLWQFATHEVEWFHRISRSAAHFWRRAMGTRIIMRIELTPKAKEHLEQISDRQGMTQVAMLSRVIEWYANQPEVIQRIIVGHIPPEIERDVARLVLRNIAKPAGKVSPRLTLSSSIVER
jgi:hypothetical protein